MSRSTARSVRRGPNPDTTLHHGSDSEFLILIEQATAEGTPSREVVDQLYETVYGELRRIAAAMLRGKAEERSVSPTDLVHDAYVKLTRGASVSWEGRTHFLGVAAKAMRHILVDRARRKAAAKRGGGWRRTTLSVAAVSPGVPEFEVIALNDALDELQRQDSRMARVVELRVFAGLKIREVAEVLDISTRTVDSDWKVARAWLSHRMSV